MARRGLRAPVNITWEMTRRCNLRCVHCLSDAGPARENELTTEECRDLVEQWRALRVFQINIGGGEPFVRQDFPGLLDYAQEKGLVTCVSTNGLLIDRALAGRLSRMRMLYLQVSLDGATAEVNDAIRGRGTYRKVMEALDTLASLRVPFSINTVLTRLNFSQLEELTRLAEAYEANLRVSRFRPSGRGKESRGWLGPEKDQLEIFAGWLNDHAQVRSGDSFFCLTSEKRRRKGLDMCGAAKMTCCVAPGGEVYPCAFLQELPFLAGNVRESPFEDIWKRSSIFTRFRELDVRSCLGCYRFESCRGGCPAVAYHTYEDLCMPDPECLVNLSSTAGTAA